MPLTWVTASVSPMEVGKTAEVISGHGHKVPASEEGLHKEGAELRGRALGQRTRWRKSTEAFAGGKLQGRRGRQHRFVLRRTAALVAGPRSVQPGGKTASAARSSARGFVRGIVCVAPSAMRKRSVGRLR